MLWNIVESSRTFAHWRQLKEIFDGRTIGILLDIVATLGSQAVFHSDFFHMIFLVMIF
jgi:hypothetical protein